MKFFSSSLFLFSSGLGALAAGSSFDYARLFPVSIRALCLRRRRRWGSIKRRAVPSAIASAILTGDGRPDLAVAYASAIKSAGSLALPAAIVAAGSLDVGTKAGTQNDGRARF